MIKTRNILVVDDDPIIRMAIFDCLKGDFNVHQLADGFHVLDEIKRNTIDIVIMDIFMHAQEGLQCLEKIRELYPKLPVIMISIDQIFLDMTPELGATDTLTKPLDLGKLKSKIDNYLIQTA